MKYHFLISRSQQTGTFLGIRVSLCFWQTQALRRRWLCAQALHWHASHKPLEYPLVSLSPSSLLSFAHSFLASSLFSCLDANSGSRDIIPEWQMIWGWIYFSVMSLSEEQPLPSCSGLDWKRCFRKLPWLRGWRLGTIPQAALLLFMCWAITLCAAFTTPKNARPSLFPY